MAVTQRAEKNGAASSRACENTKIAGRCKAGANNHFGEEFDEQKDSRL